MKKGIIYGTSFAGREIYTEMKSKGEWDIVAFTDFFPENQGKELYGVKVVSPSQLCEYEYDAIIPASVIHYEVIRDELVTLHSIDVRKIDLSFSTNLEAYFWKARENFVKYFAKIVYTKAIGGSVAEGGVYKGDSAEMINRYFPDRKLYLFDTFEGYDARDVKTEAEMGGIARSANRFSNTSVDFVLNRLPHRENAVVRKGYFPDTAEGIEDSFCFVSLDFNMYDPTVAGLSFFWPRMEKGGVIWIDDYFAHSYEGLPKAVDEFCAENGVSIMPVCDFSGCAIVK